MLLLVYSSNCSWVNYILSFCIRYNQTMQKVLVKYATDKWEEWDEYLDTCDDQIVQLIELCRPKRRQNITTALTKLPQG